MKPVIVQMDRAGRVKLPKTIRQQLNLKPGDKFCVSISGSSLKLELMECGGELRYKGSVLVLCRGSAKSVTALEIERIIVQQRENRLSSATRKFTRK